MPWAVFIAAAGLSAVGVMFGWPWGAVVAVACVLLPLAITRFLLRLFPVRVWKEPASKPLRVVAVTLAPERQAVPAVRTAIPGTAGDAITERK